MLFLQKLSGSYSSNLLHQLILLSISFFLISLSIYTFKADILKNINSIKIDSVYVRDSIDRWQKGDTLYITKWHTKFKYINKVDTIVKTDSIPKIVPVVKEVEVNHIYWWQKTLMWAGGILSICIIISLIYNFKK